LTLAPASPTPAATAFTRNSIAPTHERIQKKQPHTLFVVLLLVWIPNRPKKACAICRLALHFQNIDANKRKNRK